MKSGKWLVVALVAGLAACQSLPEPSGAEKARAVAEADWARATAVKIDLRDAGFSPPQHCHFGNAKKLCGFCFAEHRIR